MIDPTDPLAHLYADLEPEADVPIPLRSTSLDALVEAEAGPEVFDDHDVDELALLVRARIQSGTLTDEESEELGLGSFIGALFNLNALGLAVTRRVAELEALIPRGAR